MPNTNICDRPVGTSARLDLTRLNSTDPAATRLRLPSSPLLLADYRGLFWIIPRQKNSAISLVIVLVQITNLSANFRASIRVDFDNRYVREYAFCEFDQRV